MAYESYCWFDDDKMLFENFRDLHMRKYYDISLGQWIE